MFYFKKQIILEYSLFTKLKKIWQKKCRNYQFGFKTLEFR